MLLPFVDDDGDGLSLSFILPLSPCIVLCTISLLPVSLLCFVSSCLEGATFTLTLTIWMERRRREWGLTKIERDEDDDRESEWMEDSCLFRSLCLSRCRCICKSFYDSSSLSLFPKRDGNRVTRTFCLILSILLFFQMYTERWAVCVSLTWDRVKLGIFHYRKTDKRRQRERCEKWDGKMKKGYDDSLSDKTNGMSSFLSVALLFAFPHSFYLQREIFFSQVYQKHAWW